MGLVLFCLPRNLGYACTLYTPASPLPYRRFNQLPPTSRSILLFQINQDVGKGGLSLRGVAVITEIAITSEAAKTVTVCLFVLYFCRASTRRVRCAPDPETPIRNGKGGHYERGLFTGGISRISKVFRILQNGRILRCFPKSGGSLESLSKQEQ